MEPLRKRVPFKSAEDNEDEDKHIMDEEEQAAVIEDIKSANAAVRKQHSFALVTVLSLSAGLQITSFFGNPLLNIFPLEVGPYEDIPIPFIFTLISLALHLQLALIGSKEDLLLWKGVQHLQIKPLPFRMIGPIATVAPVLAMVFRRPLQCILWWSITPLVAYTVQTIIISSKDGIQSITELETLKYRAPGA